MSASPFDFGWAVGFFEAEGSITVRKRGTVQLSLPNTDEQSIRRFADVISGGRVTGPFQPKTAHWKPRWTWYAYGAEAREILQRILPHLSCRRTTKALEALELLNVTA